MARNMLMDIIKKKKKTNESNTLEKTKEQTRTISSRDIFIKEFERSSGGKINSANSRFLIWFLVAVSLLFLIIAISSLFEKAIVTVHPKKQNFTIDESFMATKDGVSEDTLPFQIMVFSGEVSKNVPAGEKKKLQQKATGVVVLYNAYSESPQRLTIATRLEATNGKIYMTDVPVTIPGAKGAVPGSVEISVHAKEFGEEYNSPMTDFKIVGFKGTPKYDKFYGRSKTDIVGGINGEVRTLDASTNKDTKTELEATLKEKLMKQALAQIPKNYILYPGAINLYDENVNIPTISEGDFGVASIKATMYAFIFEEKQLTKSISGKVLSQYDGSDVNIPQIRGLTFALTSQPVQNVSEFPMNITFSLTGAVDIVWLIDLEKLTDLLVNRKKSEFQAVLSSFPNISSSEISLRPFWVRSFPSDKNKIKIINTNETIDLSVKN